MDPTSPAFATALMSGIPDAVVYADAEGRIRYWNDGAVRMFGFTAEEALDRALDLIIPERQRKWHWDAYAQTMCTGTTRYGPGQILTVPALRKDGSAISVEFTTIPLKDEAGKMIGIAAVVRDVTAWFEELRTLRRELDDLKSAGSRP